MRNSKQLGALLRAGETFLWGKEAQIVFGVGCAHHFPTLRKAQAMQTLCKTYCKCVVTAAGWHADSACWCAQGSERPPRRQGQPFSKAFPYSRLRRVPGTPDRADPCNLAMQPTAIGYAPSADCMCPAALQGECQRMEVAGRTCAGKCAAVQQCLCRLWVVLGRVVQVLFLLSLPKMLQAVL